jgi:hypothetical protein
MDKKRPSPEENVKDIFNFLRHWRFLGVLFWAWVLNFFILNCHRLLIYVFSSFESNPLILAILMFFPLSQTLKVFYWRNWVSGIIAVSYYALAKYTERIHIGVASAWSDFSFFYDGGLLLGVLAIHSLCLQYIFSVSHSRDSLVFYFPVVVSNLLIYLTFFPNISASLYQNFCVCALNSALLVMWFIYNEDYVFFFPLQKKKRFYEIMDMIPHTCLSSIVWAVVNMVILTTLFCIVWVFWREVDVSLRGIQNIFYANMISFFIIKSSALIFNIIFTENVNFVKVERNMRLPSEEKCGTLFEAIKTQDPKIQLIRYLAWKDLERISLFEPAMITEFYRDKDSWEKVSKCCLDEITTFTTRMEKYCAKEMTPKFDVSRNHIEDILHRARSILKRIAGRRAEDKLFADFEVIALAIRIIARLTVESKTKDVSGTLQLQNQHKLILETLNKAYNAMDSYTRLRTEKNDQKSRSLVQEIKQATYVITLAFYKYLGTIQISTNDTLQPFIDFVA